MCGICGVLALQPGREASVQEPRGRMRRPVEALGVGGKRRVLGGETGAQLDHVETRLGNELERQIERLGGHQDSEGTKEMTRVA